MNTSSKGTALITGASSGIGAVYADRLANIRTESLTASVTMCLKKLRRPLRKLWSMSTATSNEPRARSPICRCSHACRRADAFVGY